MAASPVAVHWLGRQRKLMDMGTDNENTADSDRPAVPSSEIWEVQVKGEKLSKSWEISVVRIDNEHGHASWGWFGETKLLVSHSGGPCRWPIVGFVWDEQIRIAHELCAKLNSGDISLPTTEVNHGAKNQ